MSRTKKELHKTTVYTRTTEGLMRYEGYSNNQWRFYFKRGKNLWYVIDPFTGLSIAAESSLDNAIDKSKDETLMGKFKAYSRTNEYKTKISEWYEMQVKANVIVENSIKI